MPVHFLANSLIGPSYTQELPTIVEFNMSEDPDNSTTLASSYRTGEYQFMYSSMSFPCWSAFRTGTPHYAKSTAVLENDGGIFGSSQTKFDATWQRIVVHYNPSKCGAYREDTAYDGLDNLEHAHETQRSDWSYATGDCFLSRDVLCSLHDPGAAKCRLNVRMSAAFTLMACLTIKAMYMCAVNLLARGKVKQHCLTFGDILVASASHPELRIQGYVCFQFGVLLMVTVNSECMVNATDNFRRAYSHTCHKHCFSDEVSKTGGERAIFHCYVPTRLTSLR
jgi:hypothetical protein